MQYVTTAERIGFKKGIERGIERGIEQGIEQGILRGEARLLRRQLLRRFGTLPDWVDARLGAASAAELDVWGERLLDAPGLDDVFEASTDLQGER